MQDSKEINTENKQNNNNNKKHSRYFPGGPVADSTLPTQGAQVRSLVGELDPTHMLQLRPSTAK